MKSFFASIILVLTFCVGTFAQTSETSPCPTISVTGPAGVFEPGEIITFTVSLSKEAEKFNPKYNWTVTGGEIVEGQATQVIRVLVPKVSVPKVSTEIRIVATVVVADLPKECGTVTASETAAMIICYFHRQIDEFSMPASRIDKARLDNLLLELQNNPLAVAYIFERFERKTSQNIIKQKIQKITDYLLMKKRIEKDRFVISIAESDENLTQYFIVPPGAMPPKIEDND